MRKLKKRKRLIYITLFVLVISLSICYAAFNTNINLQAKGNIKITAIQILKKNIVSYGDGLYKDSKSNRYVFKGTNPNNYIKLGSNLYRIISMEEDNTLKVMKNESLGTMAYDTAGTRYSSGDYCSSTKGCKIWSSKVTTLNTNEINISYAKVDLNDVDYALPEKEASLNIYLNNEWYELLESDVKNLIVTHIFNTGLLYYYETNINETIKQNEAYKWRGKIGLISAYEYIMANSNTECNNMNANTYDANKYGVCKTTNFIYNITSSAPAWTISPFSTSVDDRGPEHVMYINPLGAIGSYGASSNQSHTVFPVFYINGKINLTGDGTENSPYEPVLE